MNIKKELAFELLFGAVGDEIEDCKVIDKGEWKLNDKVQSRDTIFEKEDKTYRLCAHINGNYCSDWIHAWEDQDTIVAVEVAKVEVIHLEWREV